MRKRLVLWELCGFFFVAAIGTLLHFVYDWTGGSALAAAFSAVNESTWEHMKLLFFPMFFFALAEAGALGNKYQNFWSAKLIGILLGLALIPTLYYTYTGVTGLSLAWLNIAIFYVSAAIAYLAEARLLSCGRISGGTVQLGSAALLWLMAVIFVVLTWFPPHIPLFLDPITGQYGLHK